MTPVDRPADAAALPALEPPADLVRQRFAERLDAQRQVGDVAVVQDRDATAVGLWRLGDAQREHVRVAVEAGRGRASGEVDRPDIGQGSHTAESEQIARGRFPRRRSVALRARLAIEWWRHALRTPGMSVRGATSCGRSLCGCGSRGGRRRSAATSGAFRLTPDASSTVLPGNDRYERPGANKIANSGDFTRPCGALDA